MIKGPIIASTEGGDVAAIVAPVVVLLTLFMISILLIFIFLAWKRRQSYKDVVRLHYA